MLIRNRQFMGQRPKLSKRLIGDSEAQIAQDCELVSGELRPLRANSNLQSLDGDQIGARTLFLFDEGVFTWAGDVSVAETPVNAAVRRLFYTEQGQPPRQAEVVDRQLNRIVKLGIPKPKRAPKVSIVSGSYPAGSTLITSFYVVTFVNTWGEEGDASDPSELFTYYSGQSMQVIDLGEGYNTDLADYAVVAFRLYRLGYNEPRFIGEYPLTTTAVSDSLPLSELTARGELLSENFYPPPVGMQGIHIMANGVALGFVDQTVYVSEPFNPNAWPYSVTLRSRVVAISSFDNNAVFLTTGYPEIATIFDPQNLSTTVLAEREPCMTRRGVVQGAGGVIYPAPSGLFFIGANGQQMLTDKYMDEDDWQALNPQSFTSIYRDGEYIAFYDTGLAQGGWVFDLREPSAVVRSLSQWASAAYVKEGTDDAYLVRGTAIELYQGASATLDYHWRSKSHGDGSYSALSSRRLLGSDFDQNPTEAEVARRAQDNEAIRQYNLALIGDRTPSNPQKGIGGALGQSAMGVVSFAGSELHRPISDAPAYFVDFNLYADGALVHSERITQQDQKRLNYCDRARLWEYELSGNAILTQIDIASSFTEMHTGN